MPSCSNSLRSKIAVRCERPVVAGADGVAARAVVSQVHRAEAEVPPGGGLADIHDRIGTFHGQDVADRRARRVLGPASPLGIELAGGANHPQEPAALEQLVISQLPARRGRGDFLVRRSRESSGSCRRAAWPRAWLGPAESPDRPPRPRDASPAAWWWRARAPGGRSFLLAPIQRVELERDVAIPRKGVPRKVQMSVEDSSHRSTCCLATAGARRLPRQPFHPLDPRYDIPHSRGPHNQRG